MRSPLAGSCASIDTLAAAEPPLSFNIFHATLDASPCNGSPAFVSAADGIPKYPSASACPVNPDKNFPAGPEPYRDASRGSR
jgi:hypothetical protein